MRAQALRAVGRPRSTLVRRRILRAACELFDERGLRTMTIEAIAERAGAGKVTIYRWWPSKAAILLEAFLERVPSLAECVETDSALHDLKSYMQSLTQALRGRSGQHLASLIAEGVLDAEVGKAYSELWQKPRRAEVHRHLERAVREGELRADVNLTTAVDALFGPIYFRLLTKRAGLTKAFAETIWQSVVHGLT